MPMMSSILQLLQRVPWRTPFAEISLKCVGSHTMTCGSLNSHLEGIY